MSTSHLCDTRTMAGFVMLLSASFASAGEQAAADADDSELVAEFRISGKLFENMINRTFAWVK